MRKDPGFRRGLLVTAAAVVITACGGAGSGSEQVAGIDRGGITISQGTISGFGSVVVNGIHFSTGGATIKIEDQPGTEADLRVGQVVRVEGTVDANGTTGTARSIAFNNEVDGLVQSIDLPAARFTVLGQTVQVGSATSYDSSIVPGSLEGLHVSDRVEVSGFVGADGVINATRVERKATSAAFEVKGAVAALDTTARTFVINQLQVDYASAQLVGFTNGTPANGDVVESTGTLNGSGVLVATRVEKRSSALDGTSEDKAELEGLVNRFASVTDFEVAGQRITTTGATQYEGGTAASLSLNASVEVEGSFDTSGRVVASKVQFRQQSDVEFAGRVDSVGSPAGSLVVLGATIRTTTLTRYEDKSSANIERFSLANIAVGDYVDVHAYRDANGLVATLLEREETQSRVDVQGPATAVAAPNLTVAGVAVTTDAATQYRNKNGVTITAAEFFAAAPGSVVKIRGALTGNVVLAERAELED